MLQRQHDTEHSTSKQVIVEIMDKRNNMLIWTDTMSAFPRIICRMRNIQSESNIFLGTPFR